MCGIAGVVNVDGEPAGQDTLCSMVRLLRHRGPDASGVQLLGEAGLAHARLSIIDLSGGAQPMSDVAERLWITFNGEIYNYVELRDELTALGCQFQTRSDTEVILQAYATYGPSCVERFNGQFAFAIWNTHDRTLFLGRDRLGKKPLYYAHNQKAFVFGSEIKAVLAHPSVPRGLDLRGLDQVLTFWCTVPPRTMFEAVSELPPGHTALLANGVLKIQQYWQLDYAEPDFDRSADDYAEELRAIMVDAVRLRMLRSDVPVGAYLSGGLDSTAVTALIRKYTDVPLKTFSLAFEDPEFDESRYQRQAIDHLGITDHHEVLCRAEDIGRVFPDVVWHTEQSIVRTAPAPLFLLSRLVREQGYKVVLTGEGSDEMLGGYDIFKEAKIRRFWASQPESRWRPLLLKRLYPYLPALQSQSPAYLQAFFHARPDQLSNPFFSHVPRWDMTSQIKRLLSDDVKAALGGYRAEDELRDRLSPRFGEWDSFCQAQYLESTGLLPGYILSSQGDRVQMGNSVEGRCPFLDHRVAEFAARVPPTLKMRGLDEKHLLKRAMRGLIPEFLDSRPKQPYRSMDVPSFFAPGQTAPRFDYVSDLLSESAIRDSGLFNPAAASRLVNKAQTGGIVGIKDSMALVAMLSTQLVSSQFTSRLGRLSA